MLPTSVLETAQRQLVQLAEGYHGEIPNRIHSRDIDRGGAPAWHPQFTFWITISTRTVDNPAPDRPRVKRTMTLLRKLAPREADVVYRALVLGHSPEQIQRWLNTRAIEHGHPERFSIKDVVVLIVSALDKMSAWY